MLGSVQQNVAQMDIPRQSGLHTIRFPVTNDQGTWWWQGRGTNPKIWRRFRGAWREWVDFILTLDGINSAGGFREVTFIPSGNTKILFGVSDRVCLAERCSDRSSRTKRTPYRSIFGHGGSALAKSGYQSEDPELTPRDAVLPGWLRLDLRWDRSRSRPRPGFVLADGGTTLATSFRC